MALIFLRRIRGWEQEQLAAASGVRRRSLEAYEQALRLPGSGPLGQLLAALAASRRTFAEVITLVRRTRAEMLQAEPDRPWPFGSHGLQPEGGQEALESRLAGLLQPRQVWPLPAGPEAMALSRRGAAALWERFSACSAAGQRDLVREAAEFQTAGFCELLCEESRFAARDSAARARHLAELAVLAAANAPGALAWRSRLRGYAGSHLGNAARAAGGDLPAADRLLAAAEEQWEAGAGADPTQLLNAARVLHLKASLRRDQRRVPEALALLDQALAIDRWGETPSLLISKAKAVEELGRYEDAIGLLREADALIDAQREPVSKFLVRLNLTANLCQLQRYAEAQLLLPEIQAAARRLGNRLDLLRVDWQQGRVAAGLGRVEKALATLDRVCAEFTAQGNAYNAALITVEMAEIHVALGRPAKVRALARSSAPIFEAQGVHQEARRALALFRRAAEEERATAKLIRNLIAYLYRARHDPRLRFEMAA